MLDKKISSMLELAWYEHQFKLMGKGKELNSHHSVWKTVLHMVSLSCPYKKRIAHQNFRWTILFINLIKL
ncbi:hypothetical protein ACFDTO_38620, partial [Microbacteriaceae bacterium 4G12]